MPTSLNCAPHFPEKFVCMNTLPLKRIVLRTSEIISIVYRCLVVPVWVMAGQLLWAGCGNKSLAWRRKACVTAGHCKASTGRCRPYFVAGRGLMFRSRMLQVERKRNASNRTVVAYQSYLMNVFGLTSVHGSGVVELSIAANLISVTRNGCPPWNTSTWP